MKLANYAISLLAMAGYHFKMWGQPAHVFAGYRYLHLDFDDGSIGLKLDVKGPLVGFGVDF